MEIGQHTLAETDCCGDLFVVWTEPAADPAPVPPRIRPAGRLAGLFAPALSLFAWLLALIG
jgi:hypothetical protein